MVFSSLIFICGFLPLAMACYYATPSSARNAVLVVASLVFYGWGDPLDVATIVALITVNFFAGIAIDRAGARRRVILAAAITLNLAALVAFKYAGFIVANVDAFGASLPIPPTYLPLGISFVTFHVLSYLIDVYRGTNKAQRSFIDFALYIANFPRLIAGPIIRYHEMADQIEARRSKLEDVEAGIMRFTTGLAKKVLLANPIGAISDTIFALPVSSYPTSHAWIALVCYTLQIYFDFSAYSDMAIGLGRMFGFRFPENFDYPYTARSIRDFWHRWHMSLSRWFRDYLYIPLGGSRGGELATIRNLWIVFLLVGAWHGAAWTFIVWGAWHGLFLSLERVGAVRRALEAAPIAGQAYTLGVVLIGWALFRAPDLPYATAFICRLFGAGPAPAVDMMTITLISPQMAVLVATSTVGALGLAPVLGSWLQGLATMPAVRIGAIAAVLTLAGTSMTVEKTPPPFIYFRF